MAATVRRLMRRAIDAQRFGRVEEAETLYAKLVELDGSNASVWHYRGLAAVERGAPQEALSWLEHAERLAPDNALFMAQRARVLFKLGEREEALRLVEQAAKIDRTVPAVALQHASMHIAEDRGDESIGPLRAVLAAARGTERLPLLRTLVLAYGQSGWREEAVKAAQAVCELAPQDVACQLELFDCYTAASEPARAREALLAAARADAKHPSVRIAIAGEYAVQGRFRAARRFSRSAWRLSQGRSWEAWLMLAKTAEGGAAPRLLRELDELPPPPDGNKQAYAYYFSRGLANEKTGRFAEAFRDYDKGNTLRHAALVYSREQREAWTNSIVAHLNAEVLGRLRQVRTPFTVRARPIFVCGLPRSGTTLTERILASHEAVVAGGELTVAPDAIRSRIGCRAGNRLGETLDALDAGGLAEFVAALGAGYERYMGAAEVFTDKLPVNCEIAGLLWAVFPRARIVHVQRDVMDNCFSCFATPFSEGNAFSYALSDIAHYYRHYLAIMAHWRNLIPSEQYCEVRYEDLVADTQAEGRRLMDFCELPSSHVLDLSSGLPGVRTASFFQVRKPIYTGSIGRAQRFVQWLEPLRRALD